MSNDPEQSSWFLKKPYSIATVTSLFAGTLISIAIFFIVDSWEKTQLENEFELSARNRYATIHTDIVRHQEIVNSIAGLFSSSEFVTRKEFHTFVQSSLKHDTDIQALAWNPLITHAEKNRYIKMAHKDGLTDFQFIEINSKGQREKASSKEDYVAVYYTEPYAGNEAALGFNVASDPARLKAIQQARDTGEPVITERVKLIQETGKSFGYILFKAIYRKGKNTDTVQQRKEAFAGLAVGVFRFGDLMSAALKNLDPLGIDIWISDRSAPIEKQFLHYKPSSTYLQAPEPSIKNFKSAENGLHWRTTTKVFGRDWEFIFAAAPAYYKNKRLWQSWVSLATGLLFTILLSFYLYSRYKQVESLALKNVELHEENMQRRLYEQKLREQNDFSKTILEASANVIVVMDLDGCFVIFNPACEKLTGYQHDEVIGKPVWDFVIPKEQEAGVRNVFEHLKKGEVNVAGDYENEWLTRDGSRRLLHWSNSVLHDSDGKVSHVMALGYDITEQRESEKQHERISNELRQAQKMESLGQLTGGIAHDFNNILGIIVGYSELAITKYSKQVDKALIDYIEHILAAGERASKLVEQMLTFSRGDQTKDIPIKLAPLLKEEIKMLRSTLPSTIKIKEFINEDLPKVLMNPTQLHQILMNLSINAGDAMDSTGELVIQLDWAYGLDTESPVSHKPITGDWIELSVSDTGSGIEPEIIDKIFDPFFTTKDIGKGTGMGLSVIYRIMEDHNGHILLESEIGKGTTFRMLFPPHSIEKDIHQESSNAAIEIPKGDGSEILIVDDEEMLASQLSDLVNNQNYTSLFVTDSNEALDIFKKTPDRFSLLITDQTMPNMTGTELINKIREIRPDFPVIMCSGYSNKIDANSAEKLNIPYFDKPVKIKTILLKIFELLNEKN